MLRLISTSLSGGTGKKTAGSRWTCFGVRVPRTLDYPAVNLHPHWNAPYDHNARLSHTDRRTEKHHGNYATIRSNERIARYKLFIYYEKSWNQYFWCYVRKMLGYTSSSAMAERPRELGDFKGWVTLRLNFRLKGYVSRVKQQRVVSITLYLLAAFTQHVNIAPRPQPKVTNLRITGSPVSFYKLCESNINNTCLTYRHQVRLGIQRFSAPRALRF